MTHIHTHMYHKKEKCMCFDFCHALVELVEETLENNLMILFFIDSILERLSNTWIRARENFDNKLQITRISQ